MVAAGVAAGATGATIAICDEDTVSAISTAQAAINCQWREWAADDGGLCASAAAVAIAAAAREAAPLRSCTTRAALRACPRQASL